MVTENIEAGGKDRPFLFSYKAIKELSKTNTEGTDELDQVELMAFIGFKHGAIKEKEEVDFELSDMEDWFEEDLSLLATITQVIENSKTLQEKAQAPQNRKQRRSPLKK